MKHIAFGIIGFFVSVRLVADLQVTLDHPLTLIGCYYAYHGGVDYRKCVELIVRKPSYHLRFTAVPMRADVHKVKEISLEVDGTTDELGDLLWAIEQVGGTDKLNSEDAKMNEERPHFTLIQLPPKSAVALPKQNFVSEKVSQAIDDLVSRRKSNASRLVEYEMDGDRAPPVCVSILELSLKPGEWNGKRVCVLGYVVNEFEHHAIYATRFHRWLIKGGIWLDEREQVPMGDTVTKATGRIQIEGVFRAGRSGHMGHFLGRIERAHKQNSLGGGGCKPNGR